MRTILVDRIRERAGDSRELEFIVGTPSEVQGSMIVLPMMLVHQFEVDPRLPATHRLALARSLMAYAQGYARDRSFIPAGCLFQVASGNATMEAFARTLGGGVQPDSALYRIDYAK